MKVKVSEATGLQLDWMVDQIERNGSKYGAFGYSSDWAQGGPIIEREKIQIVPVFGFLAWLARKMNDERLPEGDGFTPLIAAMRCYVASKLGDEVEVPEELK
jgi:hypothetical protein